MSEMSYWQRMNRRRLSRRTMLSASAKAGVGAAGLALVGCGDDDDDAAAPAAAATPAAQAQAEPQAQAQAEAQAQAQAQAQAEPQAQAQAQAEAEVEQAEPEEQAVAETPVQGGSIQSWDGADLASFDGFLTFGYKAFLHGAHVYPQLAQMTSNPDIGNSEFIPQLYLADSMETPEDGVFSFHVRDNANWENFAPVNGRPVTGADVKFAYDGERFAGYPNRGALLPHIDSIDTPDDKTVTFNLNKNLAPFLLYLGHHAGPYIMPPELVADEGSRNTMIGSGPFSLKQGQYDVGTRVVYGRNPDFFLDGRPYADELVINFIGDESARIAAILSGEINASGPNPNIPNNIVGDVQDAIPDGNYRGFQVNVIGGVSFDIALEPFNDPRVRQALNNAMDRDGALALTGSEELGGWNSAMVPLPPWFLDPRPADSELNEFFRLDLDRANGLLDAAGVSPGDAPSMNFAIPAPPVYGSPYNQQALLYAQNFQDLGFDIQIDQREATEHYATTFNGSGNDGGASMTRSVQVIEPDEGLKNMYNGDSPRSPIIHGEEMFADTRLSDLLEAQTTETDLVARTEIIFDLQRHIAEKAYLLPDIAEVGWWYTSPDARNFNGPIATFTPDSTWTNLWFAT